MNTTQTAPDPGTLATYHAGSDRYAMVVVGTERNGRTLLVDWLSNVQDSCGDAPWNDEQIAAHVEARLAAERKARFGEAFKRFTLRTNGQWKQQGASGRGFNLTLGVAADYRDPSF
jgi:hypothetical protein